MAPVVLRADASIRLDKFLAQRLPDHSRARLAEWIDAGHVLVDGKLQKRSFALEAGMEVTVEPLQERHSHDLTPAAINLEILFEDEHLMVVNKPRGLASHPAPSLKEPSLVNALIGMAKQLSTEGGEWRPGIVHRLDKETTGAMLIAKTDAAHRSLASQIASKDAVREYLAWVEGEVNQDSFTLDAPIGRDPKNPTRMAISNRGKGARTHGKVVGRQGGRTLLSLRLETGRTHQIRVHLAAAHHAVLGDQVYGSKDPGPIQLHARRITFNHPITGEEISVAAPLPDDFAMPDTAKSWQL